MLPETSTKSDSSRLTGVRVAADAGIAIAVVVAIAAIAPKEFNVHK